MCLLLFTTYVAQDPDMLVGSTPGAAVYNTPDQARTQFSLWSIMAAPLLIGSNVRNMSAWDLETYTNAEVIAIDQDPLGYVLIPVTTECVLWDWASSKFVSQVCMDRDTGIIMYFHIPVFQGFLLEGQLPVCAILRKSVRCIVPTLRPIHWFRKLQRKRKFYCYFFVC